MRSYYQENQPRRLPLKVWRRPIVAAYLQGLGQLKLTALLNKEPLGYAKITHPFHPFHGESFQILKTKNISGIETISLKHRKRGSFAVPREWTDQAEPSLSIVLGGSAHILEPYRLLELTELILNLKKKES
jgi:hypothetical protein